MSSGVPVITSDVSSMPEVAGNAAIFVDPHDANAIAGGMKKLISDKENTQSLIRLGFERFKEFSWDESAETIYNSILKAASKE